MKARGFYWALDRDSNTRSIVFCDGCGTVWQFGTDCPTGEVQFRARGRVLGPKVRRAGPSAGEALWVVSQAPRSGFYWETFFQEPVFVDATGETWRAGCRFPTDPGAFDFLAEIQKVDVWSDLELGTFEK